MELQSIKQRFGIIGSSPALNYALQVATQVSATDLTVLITGESGVGKEAFSHIIHSLSSRKHNSFIAVNCGAIPEGTIDSELFGHEKGSFTGAVDSRKGYFETVNGGTIFLDEIGEMPIATQARLLRVLETGEFIRVGSSKAQKTDVRVVAATNRDLLQRVQAGKFREDLYYRLNTVPIRVPSLRDRKEDIHLLFRKFVVDFAERYKTTPVQLDAEAVRMLSAYPWPGNVRELKNIAEQISLLASSKEVTGIELGRFLPQNTVSNGLVTTAAGSQNGGEFASEREILYKLFFDMKRDVTELKKMFVNVVSGADGAGGVQLSPEMYKDYQPMETGAPVMYSGGAPAPNGNNSMIISNGSGVQESVVVEESLNIMDKEKELIIKALKKHRGKRKDAALDLGISERTLYRKLKEYSIDD